MIGFPLFGGLLLGVMLVCTLEGGQSPPFWVVFLACGFLGVWATAVPVVHMRELVRRGAWVPPGTNGRPILLGIAVSILLMAMGIAIDFAVFWVFSGLEITSVPQAAVVGGLVGGLVAVVFVSLERIGQQLARKPAASRATDDGPGDNRTAPPFRSAP
jgi:hypothetical protein